MKLTMAAKGGFTQSLGEKFALQLQHVALLQHRLAMCTCSIGSLPNDADAIKTLNMMEPGTGLGIVDHVVAGMGMGIRGGGGGGAVRRLSSSMGPNGASIAEESVAGQASEASLSDGQVTQSSQDKPCPRVFTECLQKV